MGPDGFSPREISVERGERLCWINRTPEDRWPASNIHPTHGIYPEFDTKRPVGAGEEWCFTFNKEGIWRYHDHLRPEFSGIVTVGG